MAEKTRYTDEELEEFRVIIEEKLVLAKRDYDQMMDALMNKDSNDVDDTSAEVHSGTESCIGAYPE